MLLSFQLTPSRRATNCNLTVWSVYNISTHALTEGDAVPAPYDLTLLFQLTPSRRATLFRRWSHFPSKNFNSRPHGGRHPPASFCASSFQFQLTPSRRATAPCRTHSSVTLAFQLTPSRRATSRVFDTPLSHCYFNSRPHGGRLNFGRFNARDSTFQLTPSRRATAEYLQVTEEYLFQLTPSRRAT